jgi:hypothetical protein
MSHWSQGVGRIKDVNLLERLAKEKGCEVSGAGTMRSQYAGSVRAAKILSYKGGQAALIEDPKKPGEYFIQMDNWSNPIRNVIGNDGGTLTRDYMVETAKQEASMLGGMIASQEVLADGSVDLLIQIAV